MYPRVISSGGSSEPESRDLAVQKISPLRYAPVEMTRIVPSSQAVEMTSCIVISSEGSSEPESRDPYSTKDFCILPVF
jgi:hypothetical protein